jgi:hypothetical protein
MSKSAINNLLKDIKKGESIDKLMLDLNFEILMSMKNFNSVEEFINLYKAFDSRSVSFSTIGEQDTSYNIYKEIDFIKLIQDAIKSDKIYTEEYIKFFTKIDVPSINKIEYNSILSDFIIDNFVTFYNEHMSKVKTIFDRKVTFNSLGNAIDVNNKFGGIGKYFHYLGGNVDDFMNTIIKSHKDKYPEYIEQEIAHYDRANMLSFNTMANIVEEKALNKESILYYLEKNKYIDRFESLALYASTEKSDSLLNSTSRIRLLPFVSENILNNRVNLSSDFFYLTRLNRSIKDRQNQNVSEKLIHIINKMPSSQSFRLAYIIKNLVSCGYELDADEIAAIKNNIGLIDTFKKDCLFIPFIIKNISNNNCDIFSDFIDNYDFVEMGKKYISLNKDFNSNNFDTIDEKLLYDLNLLYKQNGREKFLSEIKKDSWHMFYSTEKFLFFENMEYKEFPNEFQNAMKFIKEKNKSDIEKK